VQRVLLCVLVPKKNTKAELTQLELTQLILKVNNFEPTFLHIHTFVLASLYKHAALEHLHSPPPPPPQTVIGASNFEAVWGGALGRWRLFRYGGGGFPAVPPSQI
jgi:hypothetical protein